MKKIAITGGIGSGKSAVLKIVQEFGYPVYSCDAIYKELLEDSIYIQKVEGLFPECVIKGRIDKALLAKFVFLSAENRKKINELAHPLIMERLMRQMEQESNLSFAEVPLLFEGGYEDLFDEIWVVMRDKNARIESVICRDNMSRSDALLRIAAQFDYDDASEKMQMKNIKKIYNEGSIFALKEKIKNLL